MRGELDFSVQLLHSHDVFWPFIPHFTGPVDETRAGDDGTVLVSHRNMILGRTQKSDLAPCCVEKRNTQAPVGRRSLQACFAVALFVTTPCIMFPGESGREVKCVCAFLCVFASFCRICFTDHDALLLSSLTTEQAGGCAGRDGNHSCTQTPWSRSSSSPR